MASGVSFRLPGTMVLIMESTADAAKLKLIAELAGTIFLAAQYRRDNMTRQILVKIKDQWRMLGEDYRPWGFWVREYTPISANAHDVDFKSVPERVWFCDGSIMREENVWSWMRFVAAKILAPQRSATWIFPIGQTAFVPYEGSDDYYVEVLWGGLWGEAWRVSISPEGKLTVKASLWKA